MVKETKSRSTKYPMKAKTIRAKSEENSIINPPSSRGEGNAPINGTSKGWVVS